MTSNANYMILIPFANFGNQPLVKCFYQFFCFSHFLEARAEHCKFIFWGFGVFEDKKKILLRLTDL